MAVTAAVAAREELAAVKAGAEWAAAAVKAVWPAVAAEWAVHWEESR